MAIATFSVCNTKVDSSVTDSVLSSISREPEVAGRGGDLPRTQTEEVCRTPLACYSCAN